MKTANLLLFEQIDPYTWSLRYSCADAALFNEIKDIIKSHPWKYRRWDPDQCNGRGAWVVDVEVLDELEPYFPQMRRRRFPEKKEKEDIFSCPF